MNSRRPSVEPKLDAAPSRTRTPANSRPASSHPSPSPAHAPSPAHLEAGRPLNVTDALSYLDAVKVQFQDKPDVYNHFLDIMKDFKSQAIDTPGVIERVSMLFTGNPYLIQGFNTFLPQGYRIEISADPMDPNTIIVTTPSGSVTQSTNGYPVTKTPFRHGQLGFPNAGGPLSRSHTPHIHPQYDQPPYGSGYHSSQTDAATFLGALREEKQPAEQFNHAITFLNKIKARYSDEGHSYNQFLEILKLYQKEQKHVKDSQVYAQAQNLFKDAPDLFTEFKDFLPSLGGGGGGMPYANSTGQWNQIDMSGEGFVDAVPERKVVKRKKRGEVTPALSTVKAPLSRAKKTKTNAKADSPSFSPYNPPRSPPPLPTNAMPPPPAQLPSSTPDERNERKVFFFERARKTLETRDLWEDFLKLLNMFTQDIIDMATLVDKAKPFFGEHGQLLADFKELVGWVEKVPGEGGPPGSVRTGPPEQMAAAPTDDGQGPSYRKLPESEVRLACSGRDELCRSVLNDGWVSHPTWASEEAGFLAHKKNTFEEALHKSEEERHEYHVHLECLARTIALFQPLNDRIEEMTPDERTAFRLPPDFGGPSKSIYYRMIKKIYGRDSAGIEIIQALQDSPAIAVPVVLARFKQKDEEWRRAHREWSKTWREVDTRNFYKSLDHQGISFKVNDKKMITAKYFVADIQAIREEQKKKRDGSLEDDDRQEEDEGSMDVDIEGAPGRSRNGKHKAHHHKKRNHKPDYSFTQGSVGHQLEYSFQDAGVLDDSIKLIYSFLDHSQVHYSSAERRAVEKFLRSFVPMLCMLDGEFGGSATTTMSLLLVDEDAASPTGTEGEGRTRSGRRSPTATGSHHGGGVAPVDLRKRLFKAAKERRERHGAAGGGGSSVASPSPATPPVRLHPIIGGKTSAAEDIWIQEAVGPNTEGESSSAMNVDDPGPARKPFFANTTFYTLLRLLQLLYNRLEICKQAGQAAAADDYTWFKPNHIATELGLDDPNGPPAVLAQAREAFEKKASSHEQRPNDSGNPPPTNVLYLYFLDACEKAFDGEMDQGTFEEHMRWFFRNKAYHAFTLDKLIMALIKQIQTILSDHKAQELWTLLQLVRSTDGLCNQDIVRYRREAERHLGQDEQLYKIEWVASKKTLRIRLVGSEDPSVDEEGGSRWKEYVDAYVMDHPSEWVPRGRGGGKVFLTRNVAVGGQGMWTGGESIRIERRTYKIVYSAGGEDSMISWRVGGGGGVEAGRRRQEWLRHWLSV